MSIKISLVVATIIVAVSSCNSDKKTSEVTDSTELTKMDSTQIVIDNNDPDPTDTIKTADYEKYSSDIVTAEKIKKVIPILLEKQLVGADSSARKFVFYQIDLNSDGKDELFVGFTGMNWCGSGGCTALLLTNEGELITYFTVADFPFVVLNENTKGWKDLVVRSGGADRLLKWNGTTYPSNPSVAPKFKGAISENAPKALAFFEKPYPWFYF